MDGMATTNSPGLGKAIGESQQYPPKKWAELTGDEKIERMREIIKSQMYTINRLEQKTNEIQNFRKLLRNHKHIDGKVVTELTEYPENGLGLSGTLSGGANTENTYF